MTKIKICGVSHPAHAIGAVEAGADFIGMIFAQGRRQISHERAKSVVDAVKSVTVDPPKLVGVFVNAAPADINKLAKDIGFDMAQLSGAETADDVRAVELPVIKALHLPSGEVSPEFCVDLRARMTLLHQLGVLPLLDTEIDGQAGGTGHSFDWTVAHELSDDFNLILAGGLRPDNVANAVMLGRPWAVDVSSGVETKGFKDPTKIRGFIEAVRSVTVE